MLAWSSSQIRLWAARQQDGGGEERGSMEGRGAGVQWCVEDAHVWSWVIDHASTAETAAAT